MIKLSPAKWFENFAELTQNRSLDKNKDIEATCEMHKRVR